MPRLLRRATLAAVLVVGLLASAAGAWSVDITDTDIEFVEQTTFFQGSTPLGNLDTLSGTPVSWVTEEPTGDQPSYMVMNNYSTFTGGREHQTFTATGTFTGYLDTMAFEIYVDGPATALCGFDALAFELYIDDLPFLVQDQAEPSANLRYGTAGDYGRTRWMFTRIHERMLDYDMEVGPEVEHTITVNFANFYACNEAVVVYDSADAPSSLIFNVDPEGKRAKSFAEVDIYNPPPPLAS